MKIRARERGMMGNAEMSSSFLLLVGWTLIQTICSSSKDIINTSEMMRDGDTMVSSGGIYELGFFSPTNSTNRYVGMWFHKTPNTTVVWVANRQVPVPTKSGVLKLTESGILVLLNATNGSTIWSSSLSSSNNVSRSSPVAKLLDTGNLVVRENSDSDNYLWQSFDHPTDTFLPGMKFGTNFVTGSSTYLSSWKSDQDPSPGDYRYILDPTGYPQIYTLQDGVARSRTGPWNGIVFSGSNAIEDTTYSITLFLNHNEIYYRETKLDTSVVIRYTLSQSGVAQRWTWVARAQEWRLYSNFPADNCDTYNLCGAYGSCDIAKFPSCRCLDKFVPKDPQSWVGADWASGCVRRTNLSCEGDGFLRYSGIKLPESRRARHKERLSLEECRAECLRNCSCTAYTQLDLSKRSGCLFWFDELVDMRELQQNGHDLFIYIRMAASELDTGGNKKGIVIGSLSSVIGMLFLALALSLYIRKRKKESYTREKGRWSQDSDLPLFKYSDILIATNYFSEDNKVGEGGFGPVFKGTLEDGQEIAVKRLSSTSTQGIGEFKNEVIFIAKLQHRNLVRLLGCCIQGEENMLIYEYMPHGSLDVILFDETRNVLLDWTKRFHIINGVARGLLYLHQDSRLRIIHRDLKASNILLDFDMNPKISDFGTARSFGGSEVSAKTCQVVGTYGYMSPEYVMDGIFSIKSDVFSFGVLVLEIISGKKNRGFSHDNHHLNLLGHAWNLYKEDRPLELVDDSLAGTYEISEVIRTIHIGLLCVQKKPKDRPEMYSVVLMLGSDSVLPNANEPGFFIERETCTQTSTTTTNSINEVSITMPGGR